MSAPTQNEAIELREALISSLRAWLTTSGDVDHSLGISLRRAAVERGDPPFAALRGATGDLVSAGLAVEVGGCLKIAPHVHLFLQEQAGELGEPGTRGLKRCHASDDEQDSAPPPPPARASAAGRGAAPNKQQPRRTLPRVATRPPPALRHCVEAGLSLLLEWRLEEVVQPELRQTGYCLCGRVFNHPTLADGSLASSSALVSVRGREATTISGTIYHLGDVDPIFRPELTTLVGRVKIDEERPLFGLPLRAPMAAEAVAPPAEAVAPAAEAVPPAAEVLAAPVAVLAASKASTTEALAAAGHIPAAAAAPVLMPTPATTPETTTTPTTSTASTPAALPEVQAGFAPTPNKAPPLDRYDGGTASGVSLLPNLHASLASPSWTDWARARRLGSRCDDDGAVSLGISGYDGAGTDGVYEAISSPAAAQPSGTAEATQPKTAPTTAHMMAPMTTPMTAPMATARAPNQSSTLPEATTEAGTAPTLAVAAAAAVPAAALAMVTGTPSTDAPEHSSISISTSISGSISGHSLSMRPKPVESLKSKAADEKELDEDEMPEITPEIKPLAGVHNELDEDEMPEITPEIKSLAEDKNELDEDEEMPEIEPEIEPEDAPEKPGAELENELDDEQMDEQMPAVEWRCKALPIAPLLAKAAAMAPSLAEAAVTAMAATEPTAASEAAVLAHVEVAKPAAFPVAVEALALSDAPLPPEPMSSGQVGEVVFLPTEAAEPGVASTVEDVTLGEVASAADEVAVPVADDHAQDVAATVPTLTEHLLDAAAENKPATDEAMAETTAPVAEATDEVAPTATPEVPAVVREAMAAVAEVTAALPQATAPKTAPKTAPDVPQQESPLPPEAEMTAAVRPRPMLAAWSLTPVMLPVGFGTLASANRSLGSDAATVEATVSSVSSKAPAAASTVEAN